MIIVKLTILLLIATFIYWFFYSSWLEQNPKEAFKLVYDKNYFPKSGIIFGVLVVLDTIGILASAIYLLFFR